MRVKAALVFVLGMGIATYEAGCPRALRAAGGQQYLSSGVVDQPGGLARRVSPPGDFELLAVSGDGNQVACGESLGSEDPAVLLCETLESVLKRAGNVPLEALDRWRDTALSSHLVLLNEHGEVTYRILPPHDPAPIVEGPGQWGGWFANWFYVTGFTVQDPNPAVWCFRNGFSRIAAGHFISVAPTEDRILLVRSADGSAGEDDYLWTVRTDGTDERRVSSHPAFAPSLETAWSPDGEKIAYVPNLHHSPHSVVIVNLSSGQETEIDLTRHGDFMTHGLFYPIWNDQGTALFGITTGTQGRPGPACSVVALPVAGGEPKYVVRRFEGLLRRLTRGPDGSLFAVGTDWKGQTDLYQIRVAGPKQGEVRRLTRFGDVDMLSDLVYGPQVQVLTFTRRLNGIWQLWPR